MNKIIKSLLNGIASMLLFSLLQNLFDGMGFVQALMAPETFALALCAAVGSFIGFGMKEMVYKIYPEKWTRKMQRCII